MVRIKNILKIVGAFFVLLLFFFFFENKGLALERVELAQYGSTEMDSIENTLKRAFDNLDGKKLVIPSQKISFDNLDILGKKNFEIEFLQGGELRCKNFRIIDCAKFSFHGLNLKGTKEKFSCFDVIGNCYDFSIYDCFFDSEKDSLGQNTFYGIHVRANWHMKNRKYQNSPRRFRIYNNVVRNTKYDGILVHANCSDFVIEDNVVDSAKCIGIEVEGRYGGWKNTTVQPCKNVLIQNNKLKDCGDWGILLMWTDSVRVYDNISKNAKGCFLSIGCSHLEVKRNELDGLAKGFEISQEFYDTEKGINSGVLVEDNIIVAKPRAERRGVVDVRHARNVAMKNNKIKCLGRAKSACLSVVSSQDVQIVENEFESKENIPYRVMLDEALDPETKKETKSLNVKNVDLRKNIYRGVPEKNEIMLENLKDRKCHIE